MFCILLLRISHHSRVMGWSLLASSINFHAEFSSLDLVNWSNQNENLTFFIIFGCDLSKIEFHWSRLKSNEDPVQGKTQNRRFPWFSKKPAVDLIFYYEFKLTFRTEIWHSNRPAFLLREWPQNILKLELQ